MLSIDDREKDTELVDHVIYLAEEAGIEFEVTRLPVGDYVWDQQICIEHKSVDDFVNSMNTGRLDEQLVAIKQYPYPFLFISGSWSHAYRKHQFSTKQRENKLLSVLARDRIPVYQATTPVKIAEAIFTVRRFIQEDGPRVDVVRRYSHVTNAGNPVMDSYLKLPYFGEKRLERAMTEYPSFYEFLVRYRSLDEKARQKEFRWLDRRTREYLDAL